MDKKQINLIRQFNKLDKERKSLYWEIDTLSDDFYSARVELRKNFSKLKSIFYKYKQNKNLITPEILENLRNNLEKFKVYMEKRIQKEAEKLS